MKTKIYVLGVALLAFVLFVRATQNTTGAPNGNTGAPGEANCTACHGGTLNPDTDGSVVVTVSQEGNAVARYVVGQTYDVSVTVSHPQSNKFGFQVTALNSAGNSEVGSVTHAGDVALTEDTGKNRIYLTHKASSTAGTGNARTWSFQWKPEAGVSGPITFYAAGNASNGDGAPTGDLVYTTSLTLNPGTTQRRREFSTEAFRVLTGVDGTKAEITVETPTAGTLTLSDVSGRTLWSRSVELAVGTLALSVEAPPGVYVLTLATAHGVGVRKFVQRP